MKKTWHYTSYELKGITEKIFSTAQKMVDRLSAKENTNEIFHKISKRELRWTLKQPIPSQR